MVNSVYNESSFLVPERIGWVALVWAGKAFEDLPNSDGIRSFVREAHSLYSRGCWGERERR